MNDEDVTHVTRNKRDYTELKLLFDFATAAATIYYMTHPDCLDGVGPKIRDYRDRFVHKVSVWVATQDIRSLPEIDD